MLIPLEGLVRCNFNFNQQQLIMKNEAYKHLEIALGGNMQISTLTPKAFSEIMTDFARKKCEEQRRVIATGLPDRCFVDIDESWITDEGNEPKFD